MIEINLIPDVKNELLRAQSWRSFIVFIATIVSIGSIALVFVAVSFYFGQNLVISNNDKAIKDEFADILAIQDVEKTATLQNQLSEIQDVRNASPNTSRILNQILYSVRPTGSNEVKYTSVDYETDSRILTIEGETSNQFKAVEALQKTIADTEIYYRTKTSTEVCNESKLTPEAEIDEEKGACLKSTLIEEGTTVDILEHSSGEGDDGSRVVRYKVSFTLNPLALRFSSKSFGVKSPSRKDVTDSRTEIPDDIFKAKTETEVEGN